MACFKTAESAMSPAVYWSSVRKPRLGLNHARLAARMGPPESGVARRGHAHAGDLGKRRSTHCRWFSQDRCVFKKPRPVGVRDSALLVRSVDRSHAARGDHRCDARRLVTSSVRSAAPRGEPFRCPFQ